MAVYTHLAAEQLSELIAEYDVGQLVSAKGIAEGVSNSNWLIETTGKDGRGARFILTMYEERVNPDYLPFYLDLLDHLAAKGAPVPATIHDRNGSPFRFVSDVSESDAPAKPVALIEFLPGVSVDHPTVAQARSVGRALASTHLAVADFPQQGVQTMGLDAWDRMIHDCGEAGLAKIDPALPDLAFSELSFLAGNWPGGLPHGVVHCDLFPDNVLMLGDEVTGLIDFYFAATDLMAYDLAVTHAAWCFSKGGHTYRPEISKALLSGYEDVRPLLASEREHLPILARGACMRFISSRAYDWINTPADALVTRKDPMDFSRRLAFYKEAGEQAFAAK